MKFTYLKINILIVSFFITLSVTKVAYTQYTTEGVQFCPLWDYEYRDVWPRSSLGHVGDAPIRDLKARVSLSGEGISFDLKTGPNGCLPAVDLKQNQRVVITIQYSIEDNEGRSITFYTDSTEQWNDPSLATHATAPGVVRSGIKNMNISYTHSPSNFRPGEYHQVQLPISKDTDSLSNLLPIASLLMQKKDILGWTPGHQYHVVRGTNTILCKENHPTHYSMYLDGEKQSGICMGTNIIDHTTGTNYMGIKRVFVHEFGHGIAWVANGPIQGDYFGNVSAFNSNNDALCHGPRGNLRNPGWSHLSREWSGTAATEGFADFIAAITFNSLRSTYPSFSFSSAINDSLRNTISQFTPVDLPLHFETVDFDQITKTLCPPPSEFTHLGAPKDWLFFFWGLWNANDNIRYSVNDINQIWSDYMRDILRDPLMTQEPVIRRANIRLKAYCLPITTTGEDNWTCRYVRWSGTVKTMGIVSTTTSAGGASVGVGIVDVNRSATERYTGPKWPWLEEIAKHHYDTPGEPGLNPDKFEHFTDTAYRAGVIYQ